MNPCWQCGHNILLCTRLSSYSIATCGVLPVQALDSQQQDSDGEDEDRDDPPPLAARSSRRATSVGRERGRGRGHAADDAMDAEGPGAGEADHPSVPAPSVVSGRRQRTPNRRYGSD